MTIARIRQALESRTNTWAQAQTPAIPVAFENALFTPPPGRYARAFVLPGETVSDDMAGKHRRYVGVFQVSLYLPLNAGTAESAALIASLDTSFALTAPITISGFQVFLTSPMSPGPAIPDGTRYQIPVSCRYRAEEDKA